MSERAEGSKKEGKGKKPRRNKPTSKKWSKYKVEIEKISKIAKSCTRCGAGIFLANHKDRLYCGKCHYTSFEKKSS